MFAPARIDASLQAGALIPQPALSQVRQCCSIRSAVYHCVQNRPPGGAEHVTGNIAQLEIRAFKCFLNSVDFTSSFPYQHGAEAGQLAQLALRSVWE
ncbi:MAG: hypothetical protein JOZ81_12065 [Chloroflexi bacterium]|nr:hypothetical protein [Chloroflexota bacterium]